MTLRDAYSAVRSHWMTFGITVLVVCVSGILALVLSATTYVSTVRLMVSVSGTTTAAAYENDSVVNGRVNSYIALLTAHAVSQRVVDRLGTGENPADLADDVSAVRVPPNTSLIDIAVTGGSPAAARSRADAYAEEFIAYTAALETPTGEDDQRVRVTVVEPASIAQNDWLDRLLLSGLVVVVALLLGAVAVFVRVRWDPFALSATRAARSAGVPFLGSVPVEVTTAEDLDAYRRRRTGLTARSDSDLRVLGLITTDETVDVVTVALNFSRMFAVTGTSGVVVTSGQGQADETGETPSTTTAPDVLHLDELSDVDPMSAGQRAVERFDRLRAEYQRVIIAVPPLSTGLIATVAGEFADAVVLVASAATTRRADLRSAADDLRATGAKLVGVAFVTHHAMSSEEPSPPNKREA